MEWISQRLPESLVASTRPFVCPLVNEVFPCGSSSLYKRWNREEELLYNGARVYKIKVEGMVKQTLLLTCPGMELGSSIGIEERVHLWLGRSEVRNA